MTIDTLGNMIITLGNMIIFKEELRFVMSLDQLLTVVILQHSFAVAAHDEVVDDAATIIEDLVILVELMIEVVLVSAPDDVEHAARFET